MTKHHLSISLLLLSVAVLINTSTARGQDKPSVSKIETALDAKIKISFLETRLHEVLAHLQKTSGVNILLDRKALSDVGVDANVSITRELTKMSLRSALELILKDVELTYILGDESILITAGEGCPGLVTRLYDVKDLVTVPASTVDPLLYDTTQPVFDFASLIDLITITLAPDTWEDVGGAGAITPFGDRFVVAQFEYIHDEIERLFAGLRQAIVESRKLKAAEKKYTTVIHMPRDQETHTTISGALSKRANLDFKDVSLRDFAIALNQHIPVVVDWKALKDIGFRPDQPILINITVKSMILENALNHALGQHELTYMIKDDYLLITNPDIAWSPLETRIYPVSDLMDNDHHRDGTVSWFLGPMAVNNQASFQYDGRLTELVTATISPDSWEDVGGAGAISIAPMCDALVVCQTREVHQEIEDLLRLLRHEKRKPVVAGEKVLTLTFPLVKSKDKPKTVVEKTKPVIQKKPRKVDLHVKEQPKLSNEDANRRRPLAKAEYSLRVIFIAKDKPINDEPKKKIMPQPEPPIAVEDLVKVIQGAVEPDTWSQPDTYIGGLPGRIVIRHSIPVQRKVIHLLRDLKIYRGVDERSEANNMPLWPIEGDNPEIFGGSLGGMM